MCVDWCARLRFLLYVVCCSAIVARCVFCWFCVVGLMRMCMVVVRYCSLFVGCWLLVVYGCSSLFNVVVAC